MPLRYLDSEINPLLFVVDSYCFNQDQSYVHESQTYHHCGRTCWFALILFRITGTIGAFVLLRLLDWRLVVTPLLSGILYCSPWQQ